MDSVTADQLKKKVLGEKRKGTAINESKISKKKKFNDIKVKPPTTEEINRLRETENVFHSNLFRLQIEETLKEVKIKESTHNKISSFVKDLVTFLQSLELPVSKKLFNDGFNSKKSSSSMKREPKCENSDVTSLKPKSVNVFGSFNIGNVVKGFTQIDIAVVLPKEMFLKEDYLNEKYFMRRNDYLNCIASRLSVSFENLSIDSEIQFILRNCKDKPSLLIKPNIAKLRKYDILIHCLPERETFKEIRFSPTHNNVRYKWYFDSKEESDGKLNFPTPFYNSLVCQDMITLKNEEIRFETFNDNLNLKDALILLKIWLHQRKLNEGFGCFTNYLMSMFMVYLMKTRQLNRHMSSYQIIRNVWVALGKSNWNTNGISLFDSNEKSSLQSFQDAFDVVFVDATGNANLASTLSLDIYFWVKTESNYAVECLDNQAANFYPALFMTPVSYFQSCDHILFFDKSSVIEETIEKHADVQTRLDLRHDTVTQFSKIVINLLKKSLGDRIIQIVHFVNPPFLSWPVGEKPPTIDNVIFGLRVNPEFAYNIIDKGPVANLPEAEEFRKFWGEKSELRRFRDGNVCETVCWASSSDSLKQKRSIVQNIVKFILQKALQIQDHHYVYVSDETENVLYDSLKNIFDIKGTAEEVTLNVLSSFDNLSKQLRELDDIPLSITALQGISPVFRYSEPFPLLPNASAAMKKNTTSIDNSIVFDDTQILKSMPLYVPPVEVTVHFSMSNKWPEDLGAIRRLQTAFYLKLSDIVRRKFKYVAVPYTTHVDILKDGYIFRLKISNNHEITAVKRQINDEGLIEYSDNKESLYLEKNLIQLPTLTSAIHGLHHQFPAFGTTCVISKRWLRSQLIDDYHFPDICVDLLVCYLFLYPQPYFTGHHPQTMFIRFLNLLSSTSWFVEPIVVNFNNELSRDDIAEIDSYFNASRSDLPPLFIVTPFDKSGVTWSKDEPSVIILNRVAKLANAALSSLEKTLFLNNNCDLVQRIFRPPLKGYDILIWMKNEMNPLRWMAVGTKKDSVPPIRTSPNYDKIPILDFHPIKLFVSELQKHYGEYCLFLYNFYGGNVIGVVLKPETRVTNEFKVSKMKCCRLVNNKLVFDIDALIDDFYIQGKGIVSHIEKNDDLKS